jgi:hypothetical protein
MPSHRRQGRGDYFRSADGQTDRLVTLAGDIVGRREAAIVTTGGGAAALAAYATTTTDLPVQQKMELIINLKTAKARQLCSRSPTR